MKQAQLKEIGYIKHNHLITFIIFKRMYFKEMSNKLMLDITSLIRAKAQTFGKKSRTIPIF